MTYDRLFFPHAPPSMTRAIIWFRSDLRLADNEALHAACTAHDEVLPVVILDPRQHGTSPFGFERSGPFRRRFLNEAIAGLDAELRSLGGSLRVVVADPAEALEQLAHEWRADVVHAQRLYGWEEQEQERAVASLVPLHLYAPNTLLHPDDLPFPVQRLPHVFTAFRNKVEKQWAVRDAFPAPARIPTPMDWCSGAGGDMLPHGTITADPRSPFAFTGDRAAALARLWHYCSGPERLGSYKLTRNGLLGADFSGRFSPWLATGTLGAREVYRAVKDYEQAHGANESSYWMVFELLWRDFFQFTAAMHGRDLFLRHGIAHKPLKGDHNTRRFEAWCEGRTGQPFIDANMRELAATGWMSNRGRQNVASYLVHDLGIDWRMGAYWFERMLIDYDPCSNWGNWQYVAGVGNDPREGRRFDSVRQAGMYDPDGRYVAHWG
jgi:deoxyribodipyrimidine photo-lyase